MSQWAYKIEQDSGYLFPEFNRDKALKRFENEGVKLYRFDKTKLFPTLELLIDNPNRDVHDLYEDDSLKETRYSLRKAIKKYDAKSTSQFKMKLNNINDKDIIDYLNSLDNKQGFIKELIRNHMQKELH